jgi:hypothetical protein
MLDEDAIDEYRARIDEAVDASRGVLDEALADASGLVGDFKTLRPRAQQMVSLASDGGHSRIEVNPFNLFVVRVVDSNGNQIMADVVVPHMDTRELSRDQFDSAGAPQTPLGYLMRDLDVKFLSQLTPMIKDVPDTNGWVIVYRDLCEWAALYHRLVYDTPTAPTVYVKDGLLRTKIFAGALLIEMGKKIEEACDRWYRERNVRVSLAGVAKHTEISEHYRLAFGIVGGLPVGYPVWAPIPLTLQEKVYTWPEYVREPDDLRAGIEDPKFNIGAMHFVRFGPGEGDRLWTADVLHSQRHHAEEVIAALTADAQDGFPVAHYPLSLQKADEFAQVAGFDRELLTEFMKDAIRERLPSGRDFILDAMQLDVDVASRRYG